MSRERLSNMDTLMMRVDNPASLSMVVGLMVFGEPISPGRLQQTIETLVWRFDRFRQRVVPPTLPLRAPRWEDVSEVDFGYHLQRVTLPAPGDQQALQELISDLAVTPLDPSRPLWQVHLVEPYGAGCAMIWRVHHCLADGVALMHVALSMTDDGSAGVSAGAEDSEGMEERAGENTASTPARVKSRRQRARRLAYRALGMLGDLPSGPDLVQLGVDVATDLSDLLISPADTDTVLRGAPSVPKRIAWSDPIPLDEIKTIGRRMGGTVNDILLTATAGALRDYLLACGTSLEDANLRALVPVNLRSPGKEMELGNRIGIIFLPLPVDIADPAERLAELKWRMDNHKGSYQAPVLNAAMRTAGGMPSGPLNLAIDYLCTKASVIVTNVKGPLEKRTLAGAPLDELMFWIPRYGGIGIAVTILSYAGHVRVGVISDRETVADPETVLVDFQDEVNALLAATDAPEPRNPDPSLAARLEGALGALDEILDKRN
jgi:diacylglycerol O-acyltransferase / wax synthase